MYLPDISVLCSLKLTPVVKERQKWLEYTSAANELLCNLASGIYQLPFKATFTKQLLGSIVLFPILSGAVKNDMV